MIVKLDMYRIKCDKCGCGLADFGTSHNGWGYEREFDSPEDLFRLTRVAGWQKINGKDYCPNCWKWDNSLPNTPVVKGDEDKDYLVPVSEVLGRIEKFIKELDGSDINANELYLLTNRIKGIVPIQEAAQ